MLWYKREQQYIDEIKRLYNQLNEKNQYIEKMLEREQQLLQDNIDNNAQSLKMLEAVLEKFPQ